MKQRLLTYVDKAKNFLESVINIGNGTVELEKVGDHYEASILTSRDYDYEPFYREPCVFFNLHNQDTISGLRGIRMEN